MTQTLQDFLHDLAREGPCDSQGAFTLDLDKAPEKFRRHQQAQPALWLVLLGRAALCWGSPRMEISFANQELAVDIAAPGELEGIFEDLQDGAVWRNWSHPRVGLLTLALEALQALPLGSLSLIFCQPGAEPRHLGLLGSPPAAERLPPGSVLRIWAKLDGPVAMGEVLSELRERLRYSPLRLGFNGEMLNEPLLQLAWMMPQVVKRGAEPSLKRNFMERIWLLAAPAAELMMAADPLDDFAHRYLVGGRLLKGTAGSTNLQHWCVPNGKNFVAEVTSRGKGNRASPLAWKVAPPVHFDFPLETGWLDAMIGGQKRRQALGVGAVLRWGRKTRGAGYLFPIHQGVLLEPVPLDEAFVGCWAYVAVPQLRTDLSQYRLIRDDACQAVVDWVQEQFLDMGSTLERYRAEGHNEALGMHYNSYAREASAAAQRFQQWSTQGWGDPADDH